MTTPQNHAAWLHARNQPFVVSGAPLTPPGAHEILVRSRALAINPFDRVVQTLGGMITPWVHYPAVLGSDVAGEVVAVGADVTRFKPGDRVLGLALGIDKLANRAAEGAFQTFVILRADAASPIPDALSFEQAAVLPLAVATAACGLFLDAQLGLRRPSVGRAAPRRHEAVVVWGGATSVGSCAIQLAAAAGYRVHATASPRNFEHVRKLGASEVFDYADRRAVDQVVGSLQGYELAGVLSIASGSGAACVDIASRCPGRQRVAMASAPLSVGDAPLTNQLMWKLSRLPRVALGLLGLALRARAKGVATSSIWGTALVDDPLGPAIFVDFLGPALSTGQFRAAPDPLVMGASLDDIPAAMEALRRGVSARKIVVSL